MNEVDAEMDIPHASPLGPNPSRPDGGQSIGTNQDVSAGGGDKPQVLSNRPASAAALEKVSSQPHLRCCVFSNRLRKREEDLQDTKN